MKKKINLLHKLFNQLPKPIKAFAYHLITAIVVAFNLFLEGKTLDEIKPIVLGIATSYSVYLLNYIKNKNLVKL